ncbi:MAG: WD40/YVTN/BNR-like repeat-containing protein [bacterium]
MVYSGDISRTDPSTIYLSPYASSTKVVKSTDGRTTWGFTAGSLSTYPRKIVVHHQNSNTVYALTGSAIYKTTDGGVTWTLNSIPASHYFSNLTINPLNPDELFAVGYSYSGGTARFTFGRSTNAGVTWTTFICDTTSSSYGYSIAVDPIDTSVIYVGGYRSSGGTTTLYRSTDRGENWEEITLNINGYYPYALHINPENNNILLVAPYSSGIYRSTNRGMTWTRVATITAVYEIRSAHGAPGTIYAPNSVGIYRSTDYGLTWNSIGTTVPGTPYYCLFTSPVQSDTVYYGTNPASTVLPTTAIPGNISPQQSPSTIRKSSPLVGTAPQFTPNVRTTPSIVLPTTAQPKNAVQNSSPAVTSAESLSTIQIRKSSGRSKAQVEETPRSLRAQTAGLSGHKLKVI